jgi:hypothetical protein
MAMTHYRLYFLDKDGHIGSAEEIECECDDEAVKLVDGLHIHQTVELWERDRKVVERKLTQMGDIWEELVISELNILRRRQQATGDPTWASRMNVIQDLLKTYNDATEVKDRLKLRAELCHAIAGCCDDAGLRESYEAMGFSYERMAAASFSSSITARPLR